MHSSTTFVLLMTNEHSQLRNWSFYKSTSHNLAICCPHNEFCLDYIITLLHKVGSGCTAYKSEARAELKYGRIIHMLV